jgi:hypothetical protein
MLRTIGLIMQRGDSLYDVASKAGFDDIADLVDIY